MTPSPRSRVVIVLPRALIFLASIWLIASWLLAIGLLPPVQPSSMSYAHGLQMMLLCVTTGIMIGWPLLRLSQLATPAPIRQTLLDLIVLAAMVQVIVWPIRLVTPWSISRTAAIDATLGGWMILGGAIIAAAIGSNRTGPRNLGMLACLGMCLLGPALGCLGVMDGVLAFDLIELGPLMSVRSLGAGGGAPVTDDQWRWIGLLYAAGGAAWLTLIAWTILVRRRGSSP